MIFVSPRLHKCPMSSSLWASTEIWRSDGVKCAQRWKNGDPEEVRRRLTLSSTLVTRWEHGIWEGDELITLAGVDMNQGFYVRALVLAWFPPKVQYCQGIESGTVHKGGMVLGSTRANCIVEPSESFCINVVMTGAIGMRAVSVANSC